METVNDLRSDIDRAVADAVAAEREACAKIADADRVYWDQQDFDPWNLGGAIAAEQIAEKIRAR
jgi:hypothetical protein